MPYVYFLRCADNSLYCGYTVDLRHRVAQHQLGQGGEIHQARLPVSLVYAEELPDKSAALPEGGPTQKTQPCAKIRAHHAKPGQI